MGILSNELDVDITDISKYIINWFIKKSKGKKNTDYNISYLKLHNILYLSQIRHLKIYNRPLFMEDIYATLDGPCVDGLPFNTEDEDIKEEYEIGSFISPSFLSLSTILYILDKYGKYDTDDLLELTVDSEPFLSVEEEITEEKKPIISQKSLREL